MEEQLISAEQARQASEAGAVSYHEDQLKYAIKGAITAIERATSKGSTSTGEFKVRDVCLEAFIDELEDKGYTVISRKDSGDDYIVQLQW